jgi:hypothetical protein
MNQPKVIRDIGYTIGELNTTERELVEAIENLHCDPKLTLRLVRIIGNKFNFARNIVNGQNWLEKNGHITVDRSKNGNL